MSIQLLIADDQPVARAGINVFVAETDFEIVAEADTGARAVELAFSHWPDVVLLTLRMPGGGGLAVLRQIKQQQPDLPVIMLVDRDHVALCAEAHTLGAAGYISKGVSREKFYQAVRTVASGQPLWSRSDKRRLSGMRISPRIGAELEAPLTPREVEVLCGMTEGQTNVQIGGQLGISHETIKEHIQNILRKAGVKDRTQAAVWAVRNDLV